MTEKQKRLQTQINLKNQAYQKTIQKNLNKYKATNIGAKNLSQKLATRERQLQNKASKQLEAYEAKMKANVKYREGTVSYNIDISRLKNKNQAQSLYNKRIARHLSSDKKADAMELSKAIKETRSINKQISKLGGTPKFETDIDVYINGIRIKNPTAAELEQLGDAETATLLQFTRHVKNGLGKDLEAYKALKPTDSYISFDDFHRNIEQLKADIWRSSAYADLDSEQKRAMMDAIDNLTPEQKRELLIEAGVITPASDPLFDIVTDQIQGIKF